MQLSKINNYYEHVIIFLFYITKIQYNHKKKYIETFFNHEEKKIGWDWLETVRNF